MSSKVTIEKLLEEWGHAQSDEGIAKNEHNNLKSGRKNEEQTDTEGTRRTSNDTEITEIENNFLDHKDYSESGSSWKPSGSSCSSDDSDTDISKMKTHKMEAYLIQYINRRKGKKVPLLTHRPNVVVNVLQEHKINDDNKIKSTNRRKPLNVTRKSKYQDTFVMTKYSHPSKKNIERAKETDTIINVNNKDIVEIKENFEDVLTKINKMTAEPLKQNLTTDKIIEEEIGNMNKQPFLSDIEEMAVINEHHERNERSESEDSNRSSDLVLITNKYHKADISPKNNNDKKEYDGEWIPIGSGKTLIHKDKYRKVNWKSYTIATRTLLLATFSRRVLATHSLTGKRSPAFLNKPPKMCLDPKIVSDIIIEITSKFDVRESFVRGIITTKCADECKMLKMRLKKNASQKGFDVPNKS